MRLLMSALIATTMLSATPALAEEAEAGGSSSRMDQDMRYLEIPGQMTPDARTAIYGTPYVATAPMYAPIPQQAQAQELAGPRILDRQDEAFLHEMAGAGVTEVRFGELALQNAVSAEVKGFAQLMIIDHGKSNARLSALVAGSEIKLPTALNGTYRTKHTELQKLRGPAFDRAYVQAQVEDHEKVIQMLEYQASAGRDPQLRTFALETLPTTRDHLDMAQSLQARVQMNPR